MREWLIDLRKQKNLSQSEVAEATKISQPSYCNIENGKIRPKPETAKRIADLLGFNWTDFFKETA